MLALLAASRRVPIDRRSRARRTPERRQGTLLGSWLREYGPLVGMALMGLSAAVVVLSALFFTGVWT